MHSSLLRNAKHLQLGNRAKLLLGISVKKDDFLTHIELSTGL